MKPAAVPVLQTTDVQLARFGEAVKQNIDTLTGQHKNVPRLAPLAATATNAEIVARLNAILARMQGDQ